MSDIHGEADRFYKMLELISFQPEDHLYILGDVIDRGTDGVDLLLDIMQRPNITMILGNHEDMMLATLGNDSVPNARQLWASNGGNKTRRELLYHRTSADRHAILKFCESLPTELYITVAGKEYHLVHGYPSTKPLDQIWGRVTPGTRIEGATCIVGHTPTVYLTGVENEPYCVYYGDGWIDIDCGCGNMMNPFRRLACLCLDDLQEYYI